MSDKDIVSALESKQKQALIYASMRLRCGLSKTAARRVIKKSCEELADMLWDVPVELQKRSRYWYVFYDWEGGPPRDQYMRLDYDDFMEIDDIALANVKKVDEEHGR